MNESQLIKANDGILCPWCGFTGKKSIVPGTLVFHDGFGGYTTAKVRCPKCDHTSPFTAPERAAIVHGSDSADGRQSSTQPARTAKSGA